MRPWVTKFSGVLYDRRWLADRRAHLRLALPARALSAKRPAARARRPARTRNRRRPTTPASPRAIAPAITCSACTTRSSRRACRSSWFTKRSSRPSRLDAFKLLILADAAALSDAQCAAIREYVKRGGSVLATFARSLFDEFGVRRADFGLADVFGVSFAGRIDGPMHNSYLESRRGSARPGSVTRSSTAWTTRRASSTACSASTCGRRSRSRRR